MRDLKRIDTFCDELKVLWKKVPNWRFGQLICNLQRYVQRDLYFPEDEEFLKLLRDYLKDD